MAKDERATRLRRPDPAILAGWLEDYRGLGELRESGFSRHVFDAAGRDAV